MRGSTHPFWLSSQRPLIIAHRGGDAAGKHKENTLVAFRAAWQQGYRYSETDTVLTADGQLIAIHGSANLWDSMLRGRHSRRRLQRLSLAQIRQKFSVGGERIPLLEDVLMLQPKMKFFIDPKTDEAVLPLAQLLKKLRVTDRVCVGSFNYDRVQRFREVMGKDAPATSFIIGRAFRLVNKNMHKFKAGRVRGVEAIQFHHSLVSKPMLDLVHDRGLQAIIWTCNSPIAIKNAIKCGADGVVSDNIRLLKEFSASK